MEPSDLLELPRRQNLSSGLLYHWKKQYARGKSNNEPTQEEALLDRINKLEQMLGKLTQKIRVFKKALQNTLKEQEKDEFIATNRSLVENVRRGCELIKIARSTLYHKPKEKSLEQLKEEMDLRDQIERICLDFPRYGYRRLTKQLQRESWIVNHKRVLRVMRENDLLCRIRKRRVRTTDSDHSYPVFPNLIKDLVITSINQVWICDITYIRILTDFVYLAITLDLYSREVKRICFIKTYRYKANPFCFADGHKG